MRYTGLDLVKGYNGKQIYESVTLPIIPPIDTDTYIITTIGDRLDSLATKYYGEPRYWWILALVNELGGGTITIQPGIQLRIPADPLPIIQAYRQANT